MQIAELTRPFVSPQATVVPDANDPLLPTSSSAERRRHRRFLEPNRRFVTAEGGLNPVLDVLTTPQDAHRGA